MNKQKKYSLLLTLSLFVMALILASSCANRGTGPQGGPKDETPPVLISSAPENKSVGYKGKEITFFFNELISIESPMQKVTLSPPIKEFPTIKANGKKLVVSFADSLKDSTTYSIDFGNSIVDYNEKNPFPNYTFTFSTGSKLDTLQISGTVINAERLYPVENITVCAYADLSDSIFFKTPASHIAKTNEKGEFTLHGLKAIPYRIYALNDASQSYYYSHTGTDIAFWDSIVTPEVHLHAKGDSIGKDSIEIDVFSQYLPNDLLLKTFKEHKTLHNLNKAVRNNKHNFTLIFNEDVVQMPNIRLLSDSLDSQKSDSLAMDSINSSWFVQEKITRLDSLTYWITDSLIYQKDTLKFTVEYLKTDSLMQLVPQTDTLSLTVRSKRKSRKKDDEIKIEPLTFTHNLNKPIEVYDTVKLVFNEPVNSVIKDSIEVLHHVDTLWQKVPFSLIYDNDSCKKTMSVAFDMIYGDEYRLTIDSAAIHSIYGSSNNIFYKVFKIKKEENYSNLYIKLPTEVPHAIFQLLNNKEQVVKESTLQDSEAAFEYINPGRYFVRFFIDANDNKLWDTGDVLKHQQPEVMYYLPKELNLRENWDVEEEWDYASFPFTEQRPSKLQKPKN